MLSRKEKADNRKQEILENFYEVMVNEGIEGASIAKIAKRMGAHPSLLIHYFSTKDNMIVELSEYILQKYKQMLFPKISHIENLEERFEEFLNSIFRLECNELIAGSAFYTCYYLTFRNEQVLEKFKNMYSQLKKILASHLKIFNDGGIIEIEDVDKTAEMLISMVEGLSYYKNIAEDKFSFQEIQQEMKKNVSIQLKK